MVRTYETCHFFVSYTTYRNGHSLRPCNPPSLSPGTKITQSNNSVVVREANGASHTRPLSAASQSQAFPVHLHPLLKHFKEVYISVPVLFITFLSILLFTCICLCYICTYYIYIVTRICILSPCRLRVTASVLSKC